ncbi:hypothetical protein F404_gp104 [Vibrio phage pVp-1]|uniref:Uncharacterized protein n=1 Tax=Vibrio phage pVp-1 TaxID=1150989 RepID=H6WXJ5_9CAUD|nr:hypothetical protein F404_gp104 [Vibrio phage pVp-1]AFB83961.1 hypothetical protein pVp-1_0104 [Vibrio phage pVp-1]
MENTEKKVWVYRAGSGRIWHTPSPSSFHLMNNGEPMTREDAQDYLWEERETYADGKEEYEMCMDCQGDGCESCDGEGGWYEDWSETVERTTYCYLEEYDPKVHYMVKSNFPEYLLWKAREVEKQCQRQANMLDNKIAELEEQLYALKVQRGETGYKLAAAKLNLKETEEKYA